MTTTCHETPETASDEIKVTSEMIEAGVAALRDFDLFNVAEGWDSKDEVVLAVLGAAFRAVREGRRATEASVECHRVSLPFALVRKFLK